VITVEEWAEIRRLHVAEGLSQRAIADRLGLARKTVARALASQGPPSYSRPPAGAVFDAFEDRVRGLLSEFPSMPASVIAERVGWAGSASGSIRGSRCCGRNTAGTHRPDPRIDTPPAACQGVPVGRGHPGMSDSDLVRCWT